MIPAATQLPRLRRTNGGQVHGRVFSNAAGFVGVSDPPAE